MIGSDRARKPAPVPVSRDGRLKPASGRTVRVLAAALLVLALAPAIDAAPAYSRLRDVRFWSLGEVTRIAIETDGVVEYRAERVDSPPRIFFDLEQTRRQPGQRGVETIPVNDAFLSRIRVAQTQPGVVRIVLDLLRPAEYSISQLRHPDRLIIELRASSTPGQQPLQQQPQLPGTEPVAIPDPPPQTPPAVAPPVSSAAEPRPKQQEPPVRKQPAQTAPSQASGSKLAQTTKPEAPEAPAAVASKRDSHGQRTLIRALGLKLQRVVVDPGHGGHDTGTISRTGVIEKELVLDLAKRLGTLIEERLGAEVVYTRADDTFVPLEDRTALAMAQHADLFLSIHVNSSRSPRIAGPETFYLNFTTDQSAMDVAARENATAGRTISDYPELVEKIALNEKVNESRELAGIIQRALFAGLMRGRGYRDRGVKKAPFVVLIGAQIPSVLAEVAFLSNPRDESLLKRPDYRQRVAEALFKGVSQYADTLSRYDVARGAAHSSEH